MVIVEIQNYGETTGCLHEVEMNKNRVKSETYHHDQEPEPVSEE